MKGILLRLIWVTILVFLISVFLPIRLGPTALHQFIEETVAVFFAAISVAFLMTYLLRGKKKWGWLFPSSIFASLAVITLPGYPGNPFFTFPFLFASAIPFYIAHALHRQQWKLLLPA